LQREDVDVNIGDRYGNTPLHCAALSGLHKIVAELSSRKSVNVNAENDDKDTPLHEACYYDKPECAAVLLRCKGIKVNAKNADGKTPLDYAKEKNNTKCVAVLEQYMKNSEVSVWLASLGPRFVKYREAFEENDVKNFEDLDLIENVKDLESEFGVGKKIIRNKLWKLIQEKKVTVTSGVTKAKQGPKDCLLVVIANGDYDDVNHTRVTVALNEGNLIMDLFKDALNWDTKICQNMTAQSYETMLYQNLPRWVKGKDSILFYFIGHGFICNKEQYLVSIDGVPLSVNYIINNPFVTERATMLLFNCCRNQESEETLSKMLVDAGRHDNNYDDLGDNKNLKPGSRLVCYPADEGKKVFYQRGANSATPFAKMFKQKMRSCVQARKAFNVPDVLLSVTRELGGQREEHGDFFEAMFFVNFMKRGENHTGVVTPEVRSTSLCFCCW